MQKDEKKDEKKMKKKMKKRIKQKNGLGIILFKFVLLLEVLEEVLLQFGHFILPKGKTWTPQNTKKNKRCLTTIKTKNL